MQQRVNPFDFADTISDVGFGEEITAILEKFYDHLVCLCVLYDIQSLAIKNSDSMERGYKLKGVVSEYIVGIVLCGIMSREYGGDLMLS